MRARRTAAMAVALCLGACGGGTSAQKAVSPAHTEGPLTSGARAAKGGQVADPLGPRPALALPNPFIPPVPTVYRRADGMTVWLFERHALPIASLQVVVPQGSRTDPKGAGGLAWATANMLDEGAGKRTALQIAADIDRLGATLQTGAVADYAFAGVTALKKNFEPALAILGDVLAAPTFAPAEWQRVHALWENDLRARKSDPNAVARVVSTRKLFTDSHPYGHPVNGTLASAAKITLPMVKKAYAEGFRPERATCVVVGDVTRAEVDAMLDRALSNWKGRGAAPTPRIPEAKPRAVAGRPQIVLVDRPDAPQAVISVVRSALAADSPDAPALVRVNAALGGSFTSRLNQDLREDHGWSYGAHSRVSFSKLPGMLSASAAVHTEHTGEALKAMLADMGALAASGMTQDEVEKTKLLVRGDLVEAYEGVSAAAGRLSRNAGVGLSGEFDADTSKRTYEVTKPELDATARRYLDLANAVVVIVGPRAAIEPQLRTIGMTNIETSGPEGE